MSNSIWVIMYDLARATESEYLDWFHKVHIPEKLERPGYTWASHYQVSNKDSKASDDDTEMSCIALFGGEATSVFYNPSPAQMAPKQPAETRQMMGCRSNAKALILSSEWASDGNGVTGENLSAIDADAISVTLCDVGGNDMDFGAWLIQEYLKSIAQNPDCIGVRKLLASTGGARHALFCESSTPTAMTEPEVSEWSTRVASYVSYPLGKPQTATRLWSAPDKG